MLKTHVPVFVLGTICIVMLSLISFDAVARVYKCKDTDGNISYSQSPCVASSEQTQLSHSVKTSSVDAVTCSMVAKAAREVFSSVKRGKDAQAVFQVYGGLNGINPRMLNLINYVGSFRLHDKISGERVAQLSGGKCRSGGFGPITVEDLQFQDPMLAHQASIASQRQQVVKQYQQLAVPAVISVNFQETPLAEALRIIGAKAGVALDIDPSVTGTVNLRMDNVPWLQVVGRLSIEHKLLTGQGPKGIMISTMPNR
ncbi:MAG: DUF4124 domain-containing protein [Sulfuriflexus sp.]|nr:DUF4124 domain-containing protein [Sulfuriflexus sp.]